MSSAKSRLPADEYKNYRNVRAVAVLFVLLGSILVLGGFIGLVAGNPDPARQEKMHPAIAAVLMAAGACGAVGGIAILRGNRQFAPVIYGMAALYLLAFPLGTILSVVLFTGLPQYLRSLSKLEQRTGRKARPRTHEEFPDED